MLILSRNLNERIVLAGGPLAQCPITITVVRVGHGNQVRLGIDAPRDVTILRQELAETGAQRDRETERQGDRVEDTP